MFSYIVQTWKLSWTIFWQWNDVVLIFPLRYSMWTMLLTLQLLVFAYILFKRLKTEFRAWNAAPLDFTMHDNYKALFCEIFFLPIQIKISYTTSCRVSHDNLKKKIWTGKDSNSVFIWMYTAVKHQEKEKNETFTTSRFTTNLWPLSLSLSGGPVQTKSDSKKGEKLKGKLGQNPV